MYSKADLFKAPPIGKLTALHMIRSDYSGLRYLVKTIRDLDPTKESFLIKKPIFTGSTRAHKLHGDVMDITDVAGETPTKKVQNALREDDRVRLAGYAWIQNGEERVVPFANLLEGLKLYCFDKSMPGSPLRKYDGFGKAAYAYITIPGRKSKERRNKIILKDIPTSSEADWKAVHTTNNCCDNNNWMEVRFSHGDELERKTFCEHEIAAYWVAADHFFQEDNLIPAQQSPFAYPSQEFVDFYQKMTRRTMIIRSGRKARLNAVEQEILLMKYARDVCIGSAFCVGGKLSERRFII